MMMKFSGLFLILISFTGLVHLRECNHPKPARGAEQDKLDTPAPTAVPGEKEKPGTMDGEIKELAAGNHCSVFESFVFVARDAHTYQALKTLNITLPDQDANFFSSHAVIAAFLGQRRTGGFGVNISPGADGMVQVAERVPKGMVTMVLTTPFKIVAVPIKEDGPITLSLDESWKNRWRSYRLTNGELTITGGFAGVQENSALEGTLQIMRERTLATFTFQLKSTGKRKTELRDSTSGIVTESDQVSLTYLESRALSGAIQSPFKAAGQFTNDEQELALSLETVPSPQISDNFAGHASLRAIAITPRPPNRAITGDQ
jgi:hypothetical protein